MTITKIMSVILLGFPVTLTLLLVSFILASLLGVALGWLYLRKNGLLSGLARVYLGIVRGRLLVNVVTQLLWVTCVTEGSGDQH